MRHRGGGRQHREGVTEAPAPRRRSTPRPGPGLLRRRRTTSSSSATPAPRGRATTPTGSPGRGHGPSVPAGRALRRSASMVRRRRSSTSWPGMTDRSLTPKTGGRRRSARRGNAAGSDQGARAGSAAGGRRSQVLCARRAAMPDPHRQDLVPPSGRTTPLAVGASAAGPTRDAWNGRPRRIARRMVAAGAGQPHGRAARSRTDGVTVPTSPASGGPDLAGASRRPALERGASRSRNRGPSTANSSGQLPGASTRVNRPSVS